MSYSKKFYIVFLVTLVILMTAFGAVVFVSYQFGEPQGNDDEEGANLPAIELEVVQTSTNFVYDKLSQVEVECAEVGASIKWADPATVINDAFGYYDLIYKSADGEREGICKVAISAIAKLDNTFTFQGMYFDLDSTRKTATTKAVSDTLTKAVIPAKVMYNDVLYDVSTIAYHGYYNIRTLEYVYIPPTVKYYSGACFIYCENLKKVEFDKNLQTIGNQLFMYCDSLEEVIFPKNIDTIPIGLFYSCDELKEIEIPQTVTKIESSAFLGTAIKEITLPEGLKEIGHHAFSSAEIEKLVIPETVTTIEYNAFANNPIESLDIQSSDITIGLDCFKGCTKLRQIYLSSANLVNETTNDTSETNYLLYYLKNNDVIYLNENINNITSPYINDLFTKTESHVSGYNAYMIGKYTNLKVTNFVDRVYLQNGTLYGDETILFTTPLGEVEAIKLDASMITFFNTDTIGKKLAQITYKYNKLNCVYYCLPSIDDTSLNCITKVQDLIQSYYVNEQLNVENSKLQYCYNDGGYMKKTDVNLSSDMVTGFSSTTLGTKEMTISYEGSSYKMHYSILEEPTETVTQNSFEQGVYYSQDTTEQTEHFIITIKKGSYLFSGYKKIIEEVYKVQQEVTGLKFADKITINVDDTNYPSCGGLTLYLTSDDLFTTPSSTFVHELAHALDHSQDEKFFSNSVLVEGFATYIEYLTVRKMYETNPEIYAYLGTYTKVLSDCSMLNNKIYFYDFAERVLTLGRDELAANSQYEVGARFFSYLNYRYGDFCGWMDSSTYSVESFDDWKALMRTYYNNENIFDEMYTYNQAFGDMYGVYFGADEVNWTTSADMSYLSKYNFYFNASTKSVYAGQLSMAYKDLYINIDSARHQLASANISYSELNLKTSSNIVINLYNSSGSLIRTVTNTKVQFSLEGVSFIKLVGAGSATLSLTAS